MGEGGCGISIQIGPQKPSATIDLRPWVLGSVASEYTDAPAPLSRCIAFILSQWVLSIPSTGPRGGKGNRGNTIFFTCVCYPNEGEATLYFYVISVYFLHIFSFAIFNIFLTLWKIFQEPFFFYRGQVDGFLSPTIHPPAAKPRLPPPTGSPDATPACGHCGVPFPDSGALVSSARGASSPDPQSIRTSCPLGSPTPPFFKAEHLKGGFARKQATLFGGGGVMSMGVTSRTWMSRQISQRLFLNMFFLFALTAGAVTSVP